MTLVRILLVEDDAETRLMQAEVLESIGYDVTSAPDGETALDLLTQSVKNDLPYDIVITDILMRTVSGVEVMKVARGLPQPPAVILLTGGASVETAVAAVRAGASDYVLKPAAPDLLRETVAAALERRKTEQRPSVALETIVQGLNHLRGIALEHVDADTGSTAVQSAQSTTLQVGQILFDTERHTVRWRGQALHVTPIEYALLRCLAQTPNHVRSYEDIVQRTHGLSISNQDAKQLLKSHVRNVRRKIGSGFLVNVDGAGYMLVPAGGAPDKQQM